MLLLAAVLDIPCVGYYIFSGSYIPCVYMAYVRVYYIHIQILGKITEDHSN